MCQQGEAESRYVMRSEWEEIHDKWDRHVSGEQPLTNDEIKELVVRKMMLRDAM